MKTRKNLILGFTLVLAVLGLSSSVWAGSEGLSLQAAKPHPDASGTLNVSEDNIRLEAKGLRPNAVYTVWFVNMEPRKQQAGAGEAPYAFTTDAQGNGTYESALTESPLGKWQTVMIVLHPDRNPANMKNMVEALSAKLPTAGGGDERGY